MVTVTKEKNTLTESSDKPMIKTIKTPMKKKSI